VSTARITARRPADVAREVERSLQDGCHVFVLASVAGGRMLDLERLGAARYAAGIQAQVELEADPQSSPVASDACAAGATSSLGAR
jgi:hypothetical protein